MHHRIFRTIGATVVLVGLSVAGILQISSDQPQPAEIAADDATTSTNQRVATTTKAEPFIYRVGVLSGLTTDNYWAYYGGEPSVWNSYILGPTKPALYALEPGSGTITPELATGDVTPTWDENGWRVRVNVSSRFNWSDGTPITADDFVFTFETVRSLGMKGSWADSYPATIESMHADSDHELRIEFSERPNLTVWPYGVGLAPVMAKHVWSEMIEGIDAKALYALSGREDVSGGPLRLVAASDGLVVSNANPGYPGGGGPDTVEYHVYPDDASLVEAVAAGEIDTVLTPKGITSEQLAEVEANDGVSVLSSPGNGIRYLGFNLKREPMSDQAFRTALALLLDRDELADAIPLAGEPAWTMVPGDNEQWFDARAAEANEDRYDGELAARLAQAVEGLSKAGYAWESQPSVSAEGELVGARGLMIDGRKPQTVTILTPGDAYDPARPAYVSEIAHVMRVLGFDARPVVTDFDTVIEHAFQPADDGSFGYDMYVLGWTLGNPALPSYYRPLFAGDGAMNNTGYSSDAFAAALTDYEDAFTKEEAALALARMEQTLAADLPYLPLYSSEINEVYRSDRIWFSAETGLGGIQARLGAIQSVRPKG